MNPGKDVESVNLTSGLFLILICSLWGGNVVAIRISNSGIPPLMAAAFRSMLATAILWIYVKMKGRPVLFPRGDRVHGWVIGCLFAMDFLFLYWGVAFTTASRSIIFLYTHPFWVALGAHFVVRGDRFTLPKGVGLALAFVGIISVFSARSERLPQHYWIGDLMEVAAAVFWAATTLYIKRVVQQKPISHYQTLFAQLFFSVPLLALGAVLFERSKPIDISTVVLVALSFQIVGVAFFSYLLWFWMIIRFPVSNLTAFTFLAPLFGVILGAAVLSEPVTPLVWLGMGFVGAGIYLVNKPRQKKVSESM